MLRVENRKNCEGPVQIPRTEFLILKPKFNHVYAFIDVFNAAELLGRKKSK
jgi:hypothetical protein